MAMMKEVVIEGIDPISGRSQVNAMRLIHLVVFLVVRGFRDLMH